MSETLGLVVGVIGLTSGLVRSLQDLVRRTTNEGIDPLSNIQKDLARLCRNLLDVQSLLGTSVENDEFKALEGVLGEVRDDLRKLKKLVAISEHMQWKPIYQRPFAHVDTTSLLEAIDLTYRITMLGLLQLKHREDKGVKLLDLEAPQDFHKALARIEIEIGMIYSPIKNLLRAPDTKIKLSDSLLNAFGRHRLLRDQEAIHQEIFNKQVPGTCSWLLNRDRFQEWFWGERQVLWLTGQAGSGKSVLA